MKLSLDALEIDEDIYPRKTISRKTIDSYRESLECGAVFPPILVQKIKTNGNKKQIIILDGAHRWNAHKEAKQQEIPIEYYKDEKLDKTENLEELRIISIKKNLKHGLRAKEKDIEFQCQRIVTDRATEKLNGIQKELAKQFGLSPSRISQMVGPLVSQRKQNRDGVIFKLAKLGWTQTEIAEQTGIEQPRVTQIIKKFNVEEIYNSYQKGKNIEEIAEYHNLELPVLWSVLLDKKTDQERFEEININPKVYDVWNFSNCHHLLGQKHPGRIPGEIILNFLYYYTKQNDTVYDFMAGGGTTNDACLLLKRKCYSYDLEPKRNDILKHDLIKENKIVLPSVKKADCVFTDPPYWSMKKEEYGSGFSDVELPVFYDRIKQFGKQVHTLLNKNGVFGFIIQNQTGRNVDKGSAILHTYNCSKIFEEIGFEFIRIINCPQGTQQDQPQEVTNAKENNRMLGIVRDLLVFKK